MLRITKIILKDKVFDLLNDPKIAKISMDSGKNKSIKNEAMVRTSIYLKVQFCDWVCVNKKIASTIQSHAFVNNENKIFLCSLASSFKVGYIKARYISKLKEMQIEENVNFNIPKYFTTLIEQYER